MRHADAFAAGVEKAAIFAAKVGGVMFVVRGKVRLIRAHMASPQMPVGVGAFLGYAASLMVKPFHMHIERVAYRRWRYFKSVGASHVFYVDMIFSRALEGRKVELVNVFSCKRRAVIEGFRAASLDFSRKNFFAVALVQNEEIAPLDARHIRRAQLAEPRADIGVFSSGRHRISDLVCFYRPA